jgi:hypothetical protein
VRGLLAGVRGQLGALDSGPRVGGAVGGGGERDDDVAVLAGVERELVGGQPSAAPPLVKGMVEDVPAGVHVSQA